MASKEDELQKQIDEYKKQNKSLTDQVNSLKGEVRSSQSETTKFLETQTLDWDLRLTNLGAIAQNAGTALRGAFDFISDGSGKAFGELDVLGTELQHNFGVSKARLDEFRQSIADTSPELIKMGLDEQKAVSNFKDIAKELGTAASIGNEAIIEMSAAAQRNMVVESLRSVIDTNTDIRDEDNYFNLMAAPYYPELQPNMVVLNADRGETAYIIGDTPMRLPDDATAIQAWATNAAGAESTGEAGCVTRNTYLGLFYPSGIAPDLAGNLVAVPPSHMMLRTFLRNDTVSYPWLAAAGTRRGTIDNATNIGYLDAVTGEFITTKTRIGIRDVLYINFINPLVFFTGVGLLNYGNKTSFNSQSALDRVNVARLIAYIRRQLTLAARPFVFEPNDALTRNQIAGVVETLMVDLVAKRGLYDYLVVCDESNNTPARIDRNELWIDVAIEPVKAAEFIYIPVRVLNTGELSQ
jgi:hypothetical protein